MRSYEHAMRHVHTAVFASPFVLAALPALPGAIAGGAELATAAYAEATMVGGKATSTWLVFGGGASRMGYDILKLGGRYSTSQGAAALGLMAQKTGSFVLTPATNFLYRYQSQVQSLSDAASGYFGKDGTIIRSNAFMRGWFAREAYDRIDND
jgi:hypothetical protein